NDNADLDERGHDGDPPASTRFALPGSWRAARVSRRSDSNIRTAHASRRCASRDVNGQGLQNPASATPIASVWRAKSREDATPTRDAIAASAPLARMLRNARHRSGRSDALRSVAIR